jgi:PKD repeat protein
MKRATALAVCGTILAACADPTPTGVGSFSAVATEPLALFGSWHTTSSMGVARYISGATSSNLTGKIYVAGGHNFGSPGSTFQSFDPTTNTWLTLASMPFGDYGHVLVANAAGDKLYAIGGYTGTGPRADVRYYDVAGDAWVSLPPLATGRAFGRGVRGTDGRIYVSGGFVQGPGGLQRSATAVVFDPATGVWSSIASMSTVRVHHAMAAGPDGRIYAMAGEGPFNNDMNSAEVYDPATNAWSPIAPLATPRSVTSGTHGLDGRIYAIGGRQFGTPMSSVEVYDPATNTWSAATSLNEPRWGLAAATDPAGRMFAVGSGDFPGTTTAEWVATVLLNSPPSASAGGPYATIQGSAVAFDASASSDPDNDALTFDWSFGDGSTLANGGATPSHTYPSAGTFTVTVTVGDGTVTSTATAMVTVQTPAQAASALGGVIDGLLADGVISPQVAGQLLSSVNAVAASLANGNSTAALGQLGALGNKIKAALKSGKMDEATAADLLAYCQQLRASIE